MGWVVDKAGALGESCGGKNRRKRREGRCKEVAIQRRLNEKRRVTAEGKARSTLGQF